MPVKSKHDIAQAALELLRAGRSITLDATATQAGLTKPGLMYHFPTKEALMLAVVDHVAARWEDALLAHLDRPFDAASPVERIRSYVEVALSGQFDIADFDIYSDAAFHKPLTAMWTRRFTPWLEIPHDVSTRVRARLVAARLMADGCWMADSTGMFPATSDEREQLRAITDELLKECDE